MKIQYAKAGSLSAMKELIQQGKYPERMTINDDFKNVLYDKYNKEVTPFIIFGDSMLKSKIENGNMIIVEKKNIKELKKHDIIALKIPIEDNENEIKLRFFNKLENNTIFVDKYDFKDDVFKIVPSSNDHELDSYMGIVIEVFNEKETKTQIIKNISPLEVEVINNNGLYVASFKNLDYYTDDLDVLKSKEDIALITDILKGYGDSEPIAEENLRNKVTSLIKDNESNLEKNVLSKTLMQLKYYI